MLEITIQYYHEPSSILVLDIKSQYIPEVVVVRRGAIGVWGVGEGGWVNWVGGTSGVSLQAT